MFHTAYNVFLFKNHITTIKPTQLASKLGDLSFATSAIVLTIF